MGNGYSAATAEHDSVSTGRLFCEDGWNDQVAPVRGSLRAHLWEGAKPNAVYASYGNYRAGNMTAVGTADCSMEIWIKLRGGPGQVYDDAPGTSIDWHTGVGGVDAGVVGAGSGFLGLAWDQGMGGFAAIYQTYEGLNFLATVTIPYIDGWHYYALNFQRTGSLTVFRDGATIGSVAINATDLSGDTMKVFGAAVTNGFAGRPEGGFNAHWDAAPAYSGPSAWHRTLLTAQQRRLAFINKTTTLIPGSTEFRFDVRDAYLTPEAFWVHDTDAVVTDGPYPFAPTMWDGVDFLGNVREVEPVAIAINEAATEPNNLFVPTLYLFVDEQMKNLIVPDTSGNGRDAKDDMDTDDDEPSTVRFVSDPFWR